MIHVKMDYMADIVRAFVIVVNQSSVMVLQDPVCITVLLVELERNVIKVRWNRFLIVHFVNKELLVVFD